MKRDVTPTGAAVDPLPTLDEATRAAVLYAEVRHLSPTARAAALDRACAGDEALRDEVEQLFILTTPTPEELELTTGESVTLDGDVVCGALLGGRYRILSEIGEGGLGIVYLAEQETPVHREVAVKVIRPGMDSRSISARFEAERNALSRMSHPYIAHFLDAGSTERGRLHVF